VEIVVLLLYEYVIAFVMHAGYLHILQHIMWMQCPSWLRTRTFASFVGER